MDAGCALRQARMRHQMSQSQLATRARTSQAAISRIERGVVSPSVRTLEHLLELLGERLELESSPIDPGFDQSLHAERFALSVEDRIRAQAAHAHAVRTFQAEIGVAPIYL
jgi:transcriptional regulator with XRE-family HTH domain